METVASWVGHTPQLEKLYDFSAVMLHWLETT